MEKIDLMIRGLNFLSKLKLGSVKKWYIARLSNEDLKKKISVLFIDDQWFDVIDTIRDDGWSVDHIEDLDSFSDPRVTRAHIIFVDYKGVGKKLSPDTEGLGLIRGLKVHHPKKRVILYSAHGQFGIADEIEHQKYADDLVPKDSEPFVYTEKIEKNARMAL